MNPTAPILLLDSGVGGLSILGELQKTLPQSPLIYVADRAALPYGDKSEAQIAARVCGLLGRMAERYQPRLICIACNTASTIALGMVREVLEVPIVGTVPAIKPAAALTKTGIIGLLGTAATIRQAYVDKLEAEFGNGHTLLRHAAPDLVHAAETKVAGKPVDREVFRAAVDGLRQQGGGESIDTVVLACTHFPLIVEELAREFGNNVQFIDGAAGIARRIATLTSGQEFERAGGNRAVFTGSDEVGKALASALQGYDLTEIERF